MSRASSFSTPGRIAGIAAALVGLSVAACGSSTPPEAAPGAPMNPPKENALLDDFMNPPTKPTTTAAPTGATSASPKPSAMTSATAAPTAKPSAAPTAKPSAAPTAKPTAAPAP